jgi:alcohol dehydrogenase/propanol-preferring alcohol dehydrogenase
MLFHLHTGFPTIPSCSHRRTGRPDRPAALQKLDGAKVILATVRSAEAMNSVQGSLALNGTLIVIGVTYAIEVNPMLLIRGRRSVKGRDSGTAIDSHDTLAFAAASGVRSINEAFPLERAAEAYQHMESGRARFRVVLTNGN